MALQYKPKLIAALLAGGVLTAGTAAADVTITVNNASGNVGDMVDVTWDYEAAAGDNVGGYQFNIEYDSSVLNITDTSLCDDNADPENDLSVCSDNGDDSGVDDVGLLFASTNGNPYTNDSIMDWGRVTFEILAPGTHTLTVVNEGAAQPDGTAISASATGATVTGQCTGISCYTSTPSIGSNIDFGSAVVNSTTGAQTITVDNVSADTAFDVQSGTGGTSAGATINVTAPGSFPATVPGDGPGGTTVDVTFECSPTARGAQTGTLTVANDADEPAGSEDYPFDCTGLAPNVMVMPTTINLSGIIGQTNPSDTFDVSNPDDGFTSDANNAALAESGTPEISVTSGLDDATISVDETDTVTVECDTTTAGMFSETITVSWDDPETGGTATQDVTVNCDIADQIPEYQSVPTVGSTLDFGMVDNGTTSAPMGIDVGNEDTDATMNADLDVDGASITGPDAAVFTLSTDNTPFTVPADTAPDGTNDIEVTCTPTDGSSTFTATLEVTSNDSDSGTGTASPHTYPLTCEGQPDAAFSGTPPAGSTVDFGVLPQGTSSDIEVITVTNNGSNNDLTLDCSFTGDPQIEILSPAFPATVGPGMSQDIESQCTADVPGSFSGTLACTTNDPATPTVSYDFTCTGAAIDVPTLSRWGLIGLGLTLLVGGVLAVRLRA